MLPQSLKGMMLIGKAVHVWFADCTVWKLVHVKKLQKTCLVSLLIGWVYKLEVQKGVKLAALRLWGILNSNLSPELKARQFMF